MRPAPRSDERLLAVSTKMPSDETELVGVERRGNDEDPGAAVGSSGIGSANNSPPRVIPEAGKVANDGIESEGNMPPDIFQHDESGS
jgi:hypothetical protein